MKLNNAIVDAGAIQGPKVTTSKKAEMRASLAALEKAKEIGFERVRVLMDAKEVVQDLKCDRDWSINPIILDVKALASSFAL